MGKYDDIINLPHHESDYHPRMSMASRAAQFAPFAALSGHDEAIAETARTTEGFKEMSDEEKREISQLIRLALENRKLVDIIYFIPDKTKKGGCYRSITGHIQKLDEYDHTLSLCLPEKDKNTYSPIILTIEIKNISEVKIRSGK